MLGRHASASAPPSQVPDGGNPNPPTDTGFSQISEDDEMSDDGSLQHDMIETMVKIDDVDSADSDMKQYWGSFSGLSLLQRMHNLCRHVSGLRQVSDGDAAGDDIVHAFDGRLPDEFTPLSFNAFSLLPDKARLRFYIDIVMKDACCNLQFLTWPAMRRTVTYMYEEKDHDLGPEDRRNLALLYAIMAVGRRFEQTSQQNDAAASSKGAIRGYAEPIVPLTMIDSTS